MGSSRLAQAGIELTPLTLGCEPLGGTDWGQVDMVELHAAVDKAWDLGIRVFDTADVYGLGRSEEQLSKALGARRHDAVIVSKFGIRWEVPKAGTRARVCKDASPQYLTQALEASLKRLNIEAIPIYLLHWPDGDTPLQQTIEALEQCRQQGKILSFGLSNVDWEQCAEVVDQYPLAVIEGKYSLIDQFPGNYDYRQAAEAGVARLTYGPLAQGLLSGKYDENTKFGHDDRRHRLPQFSSDVWPRNTHLLKVLREAAFAHDKTMAQVALRWIFDQGIVSSVVVGAKNPAQVEANIKALGWQLQPSWLKALTDAANVDKS